MSEELKKFFKLLKQMRDAQITAKKSHSRADNVRAESLERLVDAKLADLLKKNAEEVQALEMFQG